MSRVIRGRRRHGTFSRAVLWLYGLSLLLSLNAIKLSIGPLPLRSIALIGSAGLLLLGDLPILVRSFKETFKLSATVIAFAFLGLAATIITGDDMRAALGQFAEIHIQTLLIILTTFAIALKFGIRPLLKAYMLAFTISAIFALAQSLGIEAAWQARLMVGHISGDPVAVLDIIQRRERALGLSYSPVVFANEACTAFAAACYLRLVSRPKGGSLFDPAIFGLIAMLIVICAATGNRSPLLGLAVFIPLYVAQHAARGLLVLVPLAMLAALGAGPMLDTLADAGLRVAQTEDGSSQHREVLRNFGLLLVGDNPFGYGLDFDSTQHWQKYAEQSIYANGSDSIRIWPIHNYYLNILAKYGAIAILFIPLIIPRAMNSIRIFSYFIPYLVHIFYHNAGPLSGDALIFVAITSGYFIARYAEQPIANRILPAEKPWRRAFAMPAPHRAIFSPKRIYPADEG
ncbi:O-antigen ligase family protein [Aquisediminimonas sediminicola]|uniref:O-antigen ligase family protein n=1 Tax=Alteraquisediminimonas sediminicola TaxID=2676787 RepID=UPI001C8ED984|nr:O-antigen ligase family protein [Aquisediminimonas sediminicola]